MRIYAFGITVSVTALLCGCGVVALLFGTKSCEDFPCPAPFYSGDGAQCTYTYYTVSIFGGCEKFVNTNPVHCDTDNGAPTSAASLPTQSQRLAASSIAFPANQMQTFVATASGPAPFDLKQLILGLPFRPVLGQPTVQSGNVNCDPLVTVLTAGFIRGTVTPSIPCTSMPGTPIPTGAGSLQIAITPDAKFAFVTNFNGGIPIIDLTTRAIATTIPTSGAKPFGIVISPDGATAYVTSYDSANPMLLVVDVARRAITSTVKVATLPQNIFISPDGNLLWITSQIPDVITVLDTLTLTPVASITSVTSPTGLGFNSTGTMAYVASATSPGTVKAIDTTTYTVVKSYNVGNNPVDVRIGNGGYATVLNRSSDFVSQINLRTGQVTSDAANVVPNAPHSGLALIQ